jgi:hypothetical protein
MLTAVAMGTSSAQQESACDLEPFSSVGMAISEHACAKDATSETLQSVADAAEIAMTSCVGKTLDMDAAAVSIADGFQGTQQCDCATGRQVVQLSSRDPLALATEPDAATTEFVNLAKSVRVFSEANCEPGTKNGVLDQSAEECSVMSQGNATEQSMRLGSAFGESWCASIGATMAPGVAMGTQQISQRSPTSSSTRDLVILASQSLGNATAMAVSDTEFACSFTPSVVCALSDVQVTAIARAQLDGFVRAMVASTASECGCGLDSAAIIADIGPSHVQSAVSTHAAVCESVSAEFENMADPMRNLIQPGVDMALDTAVCKDVEAMTPSDASVAQAAAAERERRPMSVFPYAQCGSNDYARALADSTATQIAPAIATACCTPGYECVVKSRWYASCRPTSEEPSPGWNGTVVNLEGCGV